MNKKIKNISISLVAMSIAINTHMVKPAVASEINPENIVKNDQKHEVNDMLEKTIDIMNTERVTTSGAVEVDNDIIAKDDLAENIGRASDSTLPVLHEIQIDKVRVTTGEHILITAEASDDISGIKSISISFKAPSGSASKYTYLNKDSDGKYRGTLDIEEHYAEGTWKAYIITVEDNVGNSYSILNNELFSSPGFGNSVLMDLSHMDFQVYETLADNTDPVLTNIHIDKKRATKGEEILITAEASDDISGIKSISISFKAPSGSASKYTHLNKDSDGKYRGTLDIEDYYAEGIWKAQILTVEDNAGNSYSILNNELFSSPGFGDDVLMDLRHMNFEVYDTLSDFTNPVLHSISIDKNEVWRGKQIIFTAQASDDISGINNITVFLKSPNDNVTKGVYLKRDSDGNFTGTFEPDRYDAEGIWKVSMIDLEDNAGNSYYVLNSEKFSHPGYGENVITDLSHLDFNIIDIGDDITFPTLESIKLDKNITSKYDEINITMKANDDISGIKNINIIYISPSGNESKKIRLYVDEDTEGIYTGTVGINRYDEKGIWKISYIELTDNDLNYGRILNSNVFTSTNENNERLEDLSHVDFNIIDMGHDTTFPISECIKLDKNTVFEDEKINITMKTNDDIAGIKNINMMYISPSGNESKKIRLYIDEDAEGMYTGTIEIDKHDEKGRWKISYIELMENDLNYRRILNSNLFTSTNENNDRLEDLSNFDFKILKRMGRTLYTEIKISGQTYVGKTLNAKIMNINQEVLTNDENILFKWFKVDSQDNEEFIGEGKEYKLTNNDKNHYILLKVLYNGRIKERVITEDVVKQSPESNNTSSSSSSSGGSNKKENKDEQVVENIDSNTNNNSIASQIITNSDGTVAIGWNKVNEKWYYCAADGSVKTGWLKDIDGAWYYLNNSGVMSTGWIKDINNKWYYLNASGKMHTGWIKLDNKWYYLYSDGSMAENTIINGYLIGKDGSWINN